MIDFLCSLFSWIDAHNGFVIILLTLVFYTIFVTQNTKARKSNERPDVVVYIHPGKSGFSQLIELSIINCGHSPAQDIKISVNRTQKELDEAKIAAIGHKVLSYIPMLPKDKSLTTYFGVAHGFMAQDKINELEYTISYSSMDNEKFTKKQIVPIKYLMNMEPGQSPLQIGRAHV